MDSSCSDGLRMSWEESECVSETQRVSFLLPSVTDLDGVELLIMIVATFGQAVSGQGKVLNIVSILIVWRVIVSVLESSWAHINIEWGRPASWGWGSEVITL